MRILAALHGGPAVEAYTTMRKHLIEEHEALRRLDNQKLAFQHVEQHGDEAQRKKVIWALQNLLREPVAEKRRLAVTVPDWVTEAERISLELLGRQGRGRPDQGQTGATGGPAGAAGSEGQTGAGQAGGRAAGEGSIETRARKSSSRPPPPEQRVVKRRVAKEALRETTLAALVEALENLQGERFDVELVLRPSDERNGGGSA